MEMSETIKVLLEQLKEALHSETVVGKPVEAEDAVIIPVSRVSFGFGVGGGNEAEDNKEGGGGGAGVGAKIEPVAFVVVSKGQAQLLPLMSKEATMTRVIELVPPFIDLIREIVGKDDEETDEAKTSGASKSSASTSKKKTGGK